MNVRSLTNELTKRFCDLTNETFNEIKNTRSILTEFNRVTYHLIALKKLYLKSFESKSIRVNVRSLTNKLTKRLCDLTNEGSIKSK